MKSDTSNASAVPLALIIGIEGCALNDWELSFIKDINPYGFILFKRNCETPAQIKQLTAKLRGTVGRADAPVLIDQEGGRVARLKPPHASPLPPMRVFGDLARRNFDAAAQALTLNVQLIAAELLALGIDVNCIPILDLPQPDADDIIGDRAFATEPELIARLGKIAVDAALAAGLMPIVKHIPGHGRALVDSHEALPVVGTTLDILNQTDFIPFRAVNDAPWAMLAHVVYTTFDETNPASTSPAVIDFIRRRIGFDGVLIGDDLSMHALSGPFERRAAATLAAGADLALHCNGDKNEMIAVANGCRPLTAESIARLDRANARRGAITPQNPSELLAARDALLLSVAT